MRGSLYNSTFCAGTEDTDSVKAPTTIRRLFEITDAEFPRGFFAVASRQFMVSPPSDNSRGRKCALTGTPVHLRAPEISKTVSTVVQSVSAAREARPPWRFANDGISRYSKSARV